MEIKLYKTKSERERLNKILQNETPLTGTLREECSITAPQIVIEMQDPTEYNYAYITEFHRFYYISSITSVRTNLWRLTMEVDVLMTWGDQIRELYAVVDKAESPLYSSELYDDGSFRAREDTFIETVPFDNGFNDDGEFILLTAGAIGGTP